MTPREQTRLQGLNSLLAEHMTLGQAATLMGLSPRDARRILAPCTGSCRCGRMHRLGERMRHPGPTSGVGAGLGRWWPELVFRADGQARRRGSGFKSGLPDNS